MSALPMRMARSAALLGALLMAGCATYHSKPLPNAPDLTAVSALTVPASQFEIAGLKPHVFTTNGWDETAVITLAVFNNPDLKAVRLQAGVADAQLLEAGLLPDPQVSGGLAKSTRFTGYNIAVGGDLQALVTRGAAKAAARAHQSQVNLEVLWQESQVAEKARELFIQSRADSRLLRVLTAMRDLLADRCRQDEAALQEDNARANTVSANLTALADANNQLNQLRLDANLTRHQLNQLLGIEPDTELTLIGRSESRPLSRPEYAAALAALPRRRADVLALQAGYQSQEQHLREAILAQFPSLSAGLQQGRSAEEGVHTVGVTVNLTLPIFNRNRGQIALQHATRAVLYQTYQARLDQAVSEADQIWQSTRIMARQLEALDAQLPVLEKAGIAAEQSYRQRDLEAGSFVSLKSALLSQQANEIKLRASLEQARSATAMLLGLPFADAAASEDKN